MNTVTDPKVRMSVLLHCGDILAHFGQHLPSTATVPFPTWQLPSPLSLPILLLVAQCGPQSYTWLHMTPHGAMSYTWLQLLHMEQGATCGSSCCTWSKELHMAPADSTWSKELHVAPVDSTWSNELHMAGSSCCTWSNELHMAPADSTWSKEQLTHGSSWFHMEQCATHGSSWLHMEQGTTCGSSWFHMEQWATHGSSWLHMEQGTTHGSLMIKEIKHGSLRITEINMAPTLDGRHQSDSVIGELFPLRPCSSKLLSSFIIPLYAMSC